MQLRLGVEISLTVDKQLLGIKEAGGLRERVGKHRPPGRVYLSSGQLPKKDGRGDVQNTKPCCFSESGLGKSGRFSRALWQPWSDCTRGRNSGKEKIISH